MQYLQIVDWDVYQSYRKDRGTPPWIKIHRRLLTSENWSELTDAEKGQIVSIWIVAADKKGKVSANPQTLRKICVLDKAPNIDKFISLGYLVVKGRSNGNQLATTNQESDAPETETETETETNRVRKEEFAQYRERFEKFWKLLPPEMKKGKEKAWSFFKNQVKTDQDFADIQKALKNYIADVQQIQANKQPDLQYQNGSTWFNHRWKDYVDMQQAETWAQRMKREKEENAANR